MTYMTNAPRAVNLDVLADLPVAHPSEGRTAQAASFTGARRTAPEKSASGSPRIANTSVAMLAPMKQLAWQN